MKVRFLPLALGLLLFTFCPNPARSGEESGKLVLNDSIPSLVKISLDTRLRYEWGDVDTLNNESNAATIRNRVGLLTREVSGFQAFVEYEGTLAADRADYFVPGVQGTPGKTIIADPESHELNQAWVSYKTPDDTVALKVGRQSLNLDGERFIGAVGWRQNMQTYDAAGITFSPTEDLELYYGYLWQVNRIFGSEVFGAPQTDFKGQSHLINVKYKGLPFGTLTTYAYLLDLHNLAGDGNSNNTFGGSLSGPVFDSGVNYYAEFAYQTDAFENPADYAATYAHGSLSRELMEGVQGTVGIEYLGSDNGIGFNTPLATVHKFNGYADNFLVTPGGGLTDTYVSISTTVGPEIKLAAAYHYFYDDGFDVEIGQEVDLVASKALTKNVTVLAKGAFFMGDAGQSDVSRAILEMNIKY